MRPAGFLVDYGGTLIEERSVDLRAANEWLLSRATYCPPDVTLDAVLDRATRIAEEAVSQRGRCQLETPWRTLNRLIYDYLGIRFAESMARLELGFWKAAVQTRPMPGAREVLARLHGARVPAGVVSNTMFSAPVIRYELAKHGLAEHLAFVIVSSEYAVRKPHVLLFETAAARLGVASKDIWFVGDRLDTDMAGANAAGMTAVLFQPVAGEESSASERAGRADLIVTGWSDLLRHVDEAPAPVSADPCSSR